MPFTRIFTGFSIHTIYKIGASLKSRKWYIKFAFVIRVVEGDIVLFSVRPLISSYQKHTQHCMIDSLFLSFFLPISFFLYSRLYFLITTLVLLERLSKTKWYDYLSRPSSHTPTRHHMFTHSYLSLPTPTSSLANTLVYIKPPTTILKNCLEYVFVWTKTIFRSITFLDPTVI